MPVVFIVLGICFFVGIFNFKNILVGKRFLIFIGIILLLSGYIFGYVYFEFFAFNIFTFVGLFFVMFYLSFKIDIKRVLCICIGLSVFYFLLLKNNYKFLFFNTYFLYDVFLILIVLFFVNDYYSLIFSSVYLSVVVSFVDLIYELMFLDFYSISFMYMLDKIFVIIFAYFIILCFKYLLKNQKGISYEKINFNYSFLVGKPMC